MRRRKSYFDDIERKYGKAPQEVILELRQHGMEWDDIASELGVKKFTLIKWRKELGIDLDRKRVASIREKNKFRSIEEHYGKSVRDVILELRSRDANWLTIATELDISELTLWEWRRALGLRVDQADRKRGRAI